VVSEYYYSGYDPEGVRTDCDGSGVSKTQISKAHELAEGKMQRHTYERGVRQPSCMSALQ
jgi:hypothetical protein